MDKDFDKRISASEVLEHKWFIEEMDSIATPATATDSVISKKYLK